MRWMSRWSIRNLLAGQFAKAAGIELPDYTPGPDGRSVTTFASKVRCLYQPTGASAAGIALAGLAFLPPVGALVSPGL